MRLVTTVHGRGAQPTYRTRIYNRIDRWCLPYYDRVLCVSEDIFQECLGSGVKPTQCHLVHNAIDTQEYRRTLAVGEAKRRVNAPPGAILLGAVGRLSAEKGYHALIDAVCLLLHEGHDVALWIAGEGPMRPDLEQLIRDRRLGDRVQLLGFVADVRTLVQALDVYVLSSLQEGLPNSVLEAMALGAPVLATRVAGVPSLVEDGVSGVLVEPGSATELEDGVRRLIADPALAARLAAGARRRIEQSFSFARRMEKVGAIYKSALQGRNDCAFGAAGVGGEVRG
jgi:glycosyltransferase involved in cell wall biosynthesis